MRRSIILGFLSGLSVVAAMLLAVLWVRSYWAYEIATIRSATTQGLTRYIQTHRLEISRGSFILLLDNTTSAFGDQDRLLANLQQQPDQPWTLELTDADTAQDLRSNSFFGWMGFGHKRQSNLTFDMHTGRRTSWSNRALTIPIWSVFVLTLLLPLRRYASYRAWQWQWRVEQGLCPHCGYDLRASPERWATVDAELAHVNDR